MAGCVSACGLRATAASEVTEPRLPLSGKVKQVSFVDVFVFGPPAEQWETHTDLPEVMALQGRTAEEEGTGDRDEDDDRESSSEPEEERDRDADDDEDGDDEDEGFGYPRTRDNKPSGLTVNMFNVLQDNECEWWDLHDPPLVNLPCWR